MPNSKENRIPRFFLYGDEYAPSGAEFFHIEEVRSRSERYDWSIGLHTHPGLCQLVFFLDGSGIVSLDEGRSQVKSPAVVAIPPGVVHGFDFVPGTYGYVLTLAEALLFSGAGQAGQVFHEMLFNRAVVIALTEHKATTENVTQLLRQVDAEFRTSEPGRTLMVGWLVCSILMQLTRRLTSSRAAVSTVEHARRELFARYRTLVEAHYTEQWPVRRYAQELHTTESTLNRICHEAAGCTAFNILQDRMVLEARRKLTYVAAPVSRLAYELGFQDPAYFCRFFRKHTGMTPSEFRHRLEADLLVARSEARNAKRQERRAADDGKQGNPTNMVWTNRWR